MDKKEKKAILKQVFSPSSPIKEVDFFHGRISQIEKIVEAINKEGQHAILYGERGVGKTSLANIMVKSITNIYTIKVTCDRLDTFKTLWESAFAQIQFSKTTKGVGFKPELKNQIISLEGQVNSFTVLKPNKIVTLLNNLSGLKFLFIFDEFDNVVDEETKSSFADLIKSLSDNNINTTVVLVGIADSIESLIGNHQSLERCLKQVKMPRMKKEECEDIIGEGLKKLDIKIEKHVKEKIIEFASGFPHYIHLLCEIGCNELIENEKNIFNDVYLKIAIRSGIEQTSEQLRFSFRKAVMTSNNSTKWRDLLYACANAEVDEFNAFPISQIVNHYNKITNENHKNSGTFNYNLNQLLKESRGEILIKIGKGMSTRYMFKNPMMKAFVKLKINSN